VLVDRREVSVGEDAFVFGRLSAVLPGEIGRLRRDRLGPSLFVVDPVVRAVTACVLLVPYRPLAIRLEDDPVFGKDSIDEPLLGRSKSRDELFGRCERGNGDPVPTHTLWGCWWCLGLVSP